MATISSGSVTFTINAGEQYRFIATGEAYLDIGGGSTQSYRLINGSSERLLGGFIVSTPVTVRVVSGSVDYAMIKNPVQNGLSTDQLQAGATGVAAVSEDGEIYDKSGQVSFASKDRGAGIVIIGDSRTDQNNNPSRTNKNAQGYFTWAQALSGKSGFYQVANLGVSGERTDQFLARLDAAKASSAGIAVVWGGVNDIAQLYPTASTSGITAFGNIKTITDALVNVGKHVVVVLDTPVTTWNDAQRVQLNTLNNNLIKEYGNAKNVSIANFYGVVSDPSSSSAQPRAGYYADATHINIKGAYFCGKLLKEIIDPLLSGSKMPLPVGASDNYALNPNIISDNGCFITATGGTVSTGVTGTMPSNWTASRHTGTGTATVAVEASSDGYGNQISMTVSAVANDVFNISQLVDISRYSIGDTVVFEGEFTVTNASGLRAIKCTLNPNNGAVPPSVFLEDSLGGAGPDEDFTIRFRTLPNTMSATPTSLALTIRISFNASSSAVIKVRRLCCRKIV